MDSSCGCWNRITETKVSEKRKSHIWLQVIPGIFQYNHLLSHQDRCWILYCAILTSNFLVKSKAIFNAFHHSPEVSFARKFRETFCKFNSDFRVLSEKINKFDFMI